MKKSERAAWLRKHWQPRQQPATTGPPHLAGLNKREREQVEAEWHDWPEK